VFGFENGCTYWDSAFIEIIDSRFELIADRMEVCEGDSVTLSVVDAVGDILWSNEERNVRSIKVEISDFDEHDFWAESQDSEGCEARKEITIIGLPVPKGTTIVTDSHTICRGALAILTIDGDDLTSYVWRHTNDTNRSTEVLPRRQTTYSAIAFGGPNRTGCSDTASITIDVINCDEIFFPTAIRLSSQNPENRIFRPIGVSREYSQYYFAVFDRWGQLIFESNNLDVGWNGTHQGQNVRPGVYAFVFRLTNRGDVWERVGTITVVD